MHRKVDLSQIFNKYLFIAEGKIEPHQVGTSEKGSKWMQKNATVKKQRNWKDLILGHINQNTKLAHKNCKKCMTYQHTLTFHVTMKFSLLILA